MKKSNLALKIYLIVYTVISLLFWPLAYKYTKTIIKHHNTKVEEKLDSYGYDSIFIIETGKKENIPIIKYSYLALGLIGILFVMFFTKEIIVPKYIIIYSAISISNVIALKIAINYFNNNFSLINESSTFLAIKATPFFLFSYLLLRKMFNLIFEKEPDFPSHEFSLFTEALNAVFFILTFGLSFLLSFLI